MARRIVIVLALVVAAAAAVWAIVIATGGGLVFSIGGVRISSRRWINPAILSLAAALAAIVFAHPDDRRRAIARVLPETRADRRPAAMAAAALRRCALLVVAAAAVSVVSFGLRHGLFVAAAADAYGYVSQADLWARGELVVRQPFATAMTWPNAAESLAPLGYRPYRPAAHGTDIVPTYSPGVPMLMAIFKLIGGPRAVYAVVPLLGGLAVLAAFLMGRRLAGSFVGASAAVLLATSPSFLFEITAPASDVAATAWWSLAAALLTFEAPVAALAGGAAAGLGILTRPNLAPLAAVLGAPLVWHVLIRRPDAHDPRTARARLLLFLLGAVPACLAIAALNRHLYGSPFTSGYGSLTTIFDWSNAAANLARYPRWLIDTQTPVVLVALAAPFLVPARQGAGLVRRPRVTASIWLLATLTLFGLYLFYQPFEEWWYLRFIQPMFPAIFALTPAAIVAALARTGMRPAVRWPLAAAIVGLLSWHGAHYAQAQGAADIWRAEQRYPEVGRYVSTALPARAALICMQHSGSARYYSGRLTVRYDLLAPGDLDEVVRQLRTLGYQPYFVLEEWELPIFRARFARSSRLGALDWSPSAVLYGGRVYIYDVPGAR